ncbi:sugar transporter [Alisedimentitalea sp. MJ-SS2]|uniref:sugar transporter n=1 Tax=Aliisedimentitalea sp. MJ-SS2 TaxID=3049795 RepID=UPI002910923A|nr:sugar transporter [Alisedimentitalea sp. MJ-SS2]MDU8930039.1 sugar transporter [Alisedimentitalea sp. MJ-SS2]
MKRRHWGLLVSFLILVLLPLALGSFYMFSIARDQYSSTVGFTVRSEEGASASDLIGGLTQFTSGAGTGTDGDVLYEFIQSQEIVERIQTRVDLAGHYSEYWRKDPLFSIWPDATIEDLLWFWKRVVRISYDQSSGLTELQVLAFDPDMARTIAQEILTESQEMINALNTAAREDAMRHALADQEAALGRLKEAREALTRYRTRTQIVDPEADIQGRMGVLNNLQQQLAQALIDHDLLTENASSADPRVTQAQLRIDVIRERIARERDSFASDQPTQDSGREDYPTLLAEYESLVVDREFAEETYRAALAAVEAARAKAARQSRYLAAYIQPTRAQSSEFPQRLMILGLMGLLLVLSWAILALVYYSIRDRR